MIMSASGLTRGMIRPVPGIFQICLYMIIPGPDMIIAEPDMIIPGPDMIIPDFT